MRLLPQQDLKIEIAKLCATKNIHAGCIGSSVGSLCQINLRLSGADTFLKKTEKFEVISLNGTISLNGIHLHVAVSDSLGNVFGGHLMDGNIIYTTCELIIFELTDISFSREHDQTTGFKELKYTIK